MEKFTILPGGTIKDRFCPFQTGAYGMNNYNQPLYMNQNCCTRCAHFELLQDGKGIITCSGVEKMVQLEETKVEQKLMVKS